METAVRPIEMVDPEKRDDWQEVRNYVEAMNHAIDDLSKLPLSNRLLKETHQILMQGVRGQHKDPGEFRRSQNWIGGATIKDAFYIPPHPNEVLDLMSDLEAFWHNENIDVPCLIRIGISHYQFETIHPFLDGNGRIGRLLITLYLVAQKLLDKPSLYVSSHLEKHKGAYFDSLTQVRSTGDMGQWIRFFLNAISETAQNGKHTFQEVLKLRERVEQRILRMGKRAPKARKLLTYLYRQPFVTVKEVADSLEITHQTANKMINDFAQYEILYETTGFQRNREFVFRDYLNLFID